MINASAFRVSTKSSGSGASKVNPLVVRRIERAIDNQISRANGKRDHVLVPVSRGWTRLEIHQVLDKYRAGGWDAELKFDPQDGDIIRLAPKALTTNPQVPTNHLTANGAQITS